VNEKLRQLWRIGLGTAVVSVLLVAALAGALQGSDLGAVRSSGSSAVLSAEPMSKGSSSPELPIPIQHVFLIMMENEQTGIIYGEQPYQTKLANTYAWGGDANSNPDHAGYYAVCHPSAPNYLALTSGQPLQCNSDAFSTYSVNNLGNLLDESGLPWVDWEESAGQHCQENNSANGLYVVRHNPFPYYSDLGGRTPGSACMRHVLPIANLTADYPYSQTPPAFTYIAPNILNDAHSSSAAYGDHWLSTFIPKLIAQPWFSSSVIFITYDEAYDEEGNENFTGYDGLQGGPVYTVAVSPYTLGVGALDYNSSHYDLLSTMEWLLGLPPTGTGHDGTEAWPALTGLFNDRLFAKGADLAHTYLPGANLSGRDLASDDLAYADLAGANLSGADLRGASLQYADLNGADLQGAQLAGADLLEVDLSGADLQGAQLRGASLPDSDLTGAVLVGLGSTPGQETNFDGADLAHDAFYDAACGAPNYITAVGADLSGVQGVPAECVPPL
jgi:hypothetical protein